jgi:hypothetical protein
MLGLRISDCPVEGVTRDRVHTFQSGDRFVMERSKILS